MKLLSRVVIWDTLPIFGRFGLSLVFLVNGMHKGLEFKDYILNFNNDNIPLPELFLVLSLIIEILGGILVMIGYKVRKAALVMSAYLIIATFVYHPIWLDMNFFIDFVKNVAIIGGLLTLAYHGPGPRSVDTFAQN